jgi:hypothetical protein
MIKIYKGTYPGFETKDAIDAELAKAADEWDHHCNVGNIKFAAQPWALGIIKNNQACEFIDKTRDEEQQEESDKARIDYEVALENEILAAQTTPSPRYADFRRMEYLQEGLTFERWNELVIEEDEDGLADFRARREAIRTKYPKYTE